MMHHLLHIPSCIYNDSHHQGAHHMMHHEDAHPDTKIHLLTCFQSDVHLHDAKRMQNFQTHQDAYEDAHPRKQEVSEVLSSLLSLTQ